MRRPGQVIAISSGLLGLGVLLAAGISLREVIREEWWARRLPSLTGEAGWESAQRLLRMGPRARRAAESWFMDRLRDRDERWPEAADLLGAHGSARSVPSLLELLAAQERNEYWLIENHPQAWRALGAIHERHERGVNQAMAHALGTGTNRERRWAARFFAAIGPRGAGAVPALVEAVRSPDRKLRCDAAMALFEVGADPELFLPVVARELREVEDEEEEGTSPAALVVCRMGRSARALLPVVLGRLREKRFQGLPSFTEAVTGMGSSGVPALVLALADADPDVRAGAARVLGRIGPDAEPAVPALIGVMRDHDDRAATQAAVALGKIGPGARAAAPALIRVVERGRDDPFTRACIEALGLLGAEAREALPALLSVAERGEVRSVVSCARALTRIGIDGEASRKSRRLVPALEKVLDSSSAASPHSGVWVSCALAMIAPEREAELVAAIALGLNGRRYEAAEAAAEALGCLRTRAGCTAPLLRQRALEKDFWGSAHREAARALRKMGLRDLSPFLDALKHGDESVRSRAAAALGILAPGTPEAVQVLVVALHDRSEDVRKHAAAALGSFGPRAGAATPALREALRDRHRGYRQAAYEALERIQGRGD